MPHDVFISYSHKDKTVANAACAILESEHLRCWMAPRDILPGSAWTESIIDAIGNAKAMVLIFSSHSDTSPQVQREVERAMHHSIPIVPVRVENVAPGKAMQYLISTAHWLDAITPPMEWHYRHLARSIKALISQQTTEKRPTETVVPPQPDPEPRTRFAQPKLLAIVAVVVALFLMAGIYFGSNVFSHHPNAAQAAAPGPTQASSAPPESESAASPVPPLRPTVPATTPQPAVPVPNAPAYTGTIIINSLDMKLVEIRPGSFMMGSPPAENNRSDDETLHKVTLTKGFYIGQTEVTCAQFKTFVDDTRYVTLAEKDNSSTHWAGAGIIPGGDWRHTGFEQPGDFPVVSVNWDDAMAFCDWLSRKEGKRYRLPTEAEFEYCARAGTAAPYAWGDNPDDGKGWANLRDIVWRNRFPDLSTFDWSDGYQFSSPVRKFPPNAWYLYDMNGNVYNWCSDWYGDIKATDTVDPQGPDEAGRRTL